MLKNSILRGIALITVIGMWTSVDASNTSSPSTNTAPKENKKFLELVKIFNTTCKKMNDDVEFPVRNEHPLFIKFCEDVSSKYIQKNEKK